MPSIFDALAGAGQGAAGAQAYQIGKAGVQEAQGRARTRDVANAAAVHALRRTIEEDRMDDNMRAAWAEGIAKVNEIQSMLPPPDADKAAVSRFYQGQDDPTQQALETLRTMSKRVAKVSPQAAVALMEQAAPLIKNRAVEGRLRKVQERGSKVMEGIGALAADGGLSEAAVAEFQGRLQSVLEAMDADPMRLDQGDQAIAAIQSAATDAYLKGRQRAEATQHVAQLTDMLPPTLKWMGAVAAANIAMGEDPVKERSRIANQVFGEAVPDADYEMQRPRAWAETPQWVKAHINAQADEDMLTYLSKLKVADKFGNERGLSPDEILTESERFTPLFRQMARAKFNKWGDDEAAGAAPVPQLQPGALQGVQSGPAPQSANGDIIGYKAGQAAPGAPQWAVEGAEGPIRGNMKRRANQTPKAFLAQVQRAVAEQGGTEEDVKRILEENGLTPADFKGKE